MLNRRQFLTTSAAAFAGAAAARAADARPNILIILADDLGWNDVGYHGSEIRTPSIDRLAEQGTRFERAYSFPVCSPTRSGLMTGRSPMRLGTGYTVIRPWSSFGISTAERFLPQAFQQAGYQTSIAGKWHLGHGYKKFLPRARGFDHSYGHVNGAIDYFTHVRDGGLDWNRNGVSLKEEGYSTFLLGDETVRLIKQRDRNKPFFHYLAFNSPHTPLQVPAGFTDRYANVADPRRRTFCAMVEAMDTTIGRVLAALDAEKVAENTLVLFFSDNGGPTGNGATNNPLRGGKAGTFEGGIRVPTVMRWPGKLKAGGASQQVMTMMDYFPTFAAAAGVAPGAHRPFDGRNLWPTLAVGKTERRDDIFFSVGAARAQQFAVLHQEWKLVLSGGQTLLFRIDEDPGEKTDLSAKEPKLVAELSARIDAYKRWAPADTEPNTERAPAGFQSPPQWIEAAREG
jgi:arylsulfatase A-like enzyme